MDKRFLSILAGLTVIFVGIFLVTQNSGDKSQDGGNGSVQASNHVIGEGKKNVTVLEYGDFQCPVCLAYEPALQQVRQKYSADIKFQFRNLPLVAIHPNAFAAARAAEAADMQGKFWEMHDLLYNQTKWQVWTNSQSPAALFEGYAKELGLDVTKFKRDYASAKVNATINADLAAFDRTGQQRSTPSIFIDGKHIDNQDMVDQSGLPSVDKISKLIDDAAAKKQ